MPNLPCSQEEFYTVSRLGWLSCRQNIAAFTAHNSKYTIAFIDDQDDALDAAEDLPDLDSRTEASRILQVNLANLAKLCCSLAQDLKNYISDTYPEDELKIRWSAAGLDHYTKASAGNWNELGNLMTDGKTFTTTNLTALTAAGMPVGFPVTFADTAKDFDEIHENFLAAEQKSQDDTNAKDQATLACYTSLSKMFAIGQRIFEADPVMLKRFTFADVLELAGNSNPTGYKGLISDAATTLPLAGVTATCIVNGYSAVTDASGKFAVSPMQEGTFMFDFQKDNFVTVTKTVTTIKGISRIQNFTMTAL
jgi:hypothetical protein